jgi:RimJ/RimL family protein N-acetyltransferase
VNFTTVSTPQEVDQILALQARNLPAVLDDQTMVSQGFVTVRHDREVLLRMNRAYPSVIARSGGALAGYCLVMPREFAGQVPILDDLFGLLETLSHRGLLLRDNPRWFVMGQVCVGEAFRGQGVFEGMYQKLREHCRADFDFVVTSIADRNTRSIRAHEKTGFKTLRAFENDDNGDPWRVVVWDF